MYHPPTNEGSSERSYVFIVGNITNSMATLVDTDYNMMEVPKYLMPETVVPGCVVRVGFIH